MIQKREKHNYAEGRLGGGNCRNEILEKWRVMGSQVQGGEELALAGSGCIFQHSRCGHEGANARSLLDCSVARGRIAHQRAFILRIEKEA